MANASGVYGGGGGGFRLTIDIAVVSQNSSTNQSLIQTTVYMQRVSSNGSRYYNFDATPGHYVIAGVQYNRTINGYDFNLGVGAAYYLVTNEQTWVSHDSSGNLTLTVSAYHNANNSPYLTTASVAVAMTAPRIPKTAILTTNNVSSVTAYTAVVGGNISDNRGAAVTQRGIVYAKNSNPTTSNSILVLGSGDGSFSGTLTNLDDYTTYHVRAYAINSAGTSYGANQSFTTLLGIQYGTIDGVGNSYADISYTEFQRGVIDGIGISNGYIIYLKQIEEAPSKTFEYKVYDKNDNYMGVWTDVSSDLNYNMRINTVGSQIVVTLARKADRLSETRDNIITNLLADLTTEDLNPIVSVNVQSETIGDGTDVDINLNVVVFVYYGDFGTLSTQKGEVYISEDGEEYLIGTGVPNGMPIFSGYISEYEAIYGEDPHINLKINSHGAELVNRMIEDEIGNTTVQYLNTDPSQIIRDVLDKANSRITYTNTSIEDTGFSEDYTFNLNTTYEGIRQALKLSSDDYYFTLNQAQNILNFKSRSTTADHQFTLGREIHQLNLTKSISQLVNRVYFVGGVPEGETEKLYRLYNDTQSQNDWRIGTEKISDSRVTLVSSADSISDYNIGRYGQPVYTTKIVILSEVYQIEDIRVGDMIGFSGFGNFVDELVLQIMEMKYTPYSVELQLEELPVEILRSVKVLEDNQTADEVADIPNIPTQASLRNK